MAHYRAFAVRGVEPGMDAVSRLSLNLSEGVRHHLQEACEECGRSLTAEVEARLRDSLNSRSSNNLLPAAPG
jgi:hypothetical protein